MEIAELKQDELSLKHHNITKFNLVGHRDQVISLCSFKDDQGNKDPNLLLSNCEDSTIRLWDLRTNSTAMLFKIPESLNHISGNI